MMNHEPFTGAEKLIRNHQRADRIIAGPATRVPDHMGEITSERIASSLALPPAFRITWASPSAKPENFAGSSRASMQVKIANRRAGGMASLPLFPKPAAYFRLASITSSSTLDTRSSFLHDPTAKRGVCLSMRVFFHTSRDASEANASGQITRWI